MAQPLDNLTRTWTSGATESGIKLSVTDPGAAAASNLLELRGGAAGTTSLFSVRKDGYTEVNPTAANGSTATVFRVNFGTQNLQIRNVVSSYWNIEASGDVSFVTGKASIGNNGVSLTSDTAVRWSVSSSGGGIVGASDLALFRDAANTLAQRNSTNAQAFRVYNTFTDASNYERFEFAWVSNAMELTMAKLGSGAVRDVRFVLNSALAISTSSAANNIAYIGGTSVGLASSIRLSWTNSTNAGSGSDTGIRRAAAAVVQLDDGQSSAGGGALQLIEMTAPAAPATNNVRIYAEDDGAGKTRLMALFATGAAQQLAIEP